VLLKIILPFKKKTIPEQLLNIII